MNERLRELRRQATLVETYTANDGSVHEGKHVDLEKFAELIVRECVCLVLNGKYDEEKFRADDEFHCGHNTALDFTAEGLQQYFGVEE